MTDEEEQALLRKIVAGLEAHKSHRQMWRLDPDGFHRCPECEPGAGVFWFASRAASEWWQRNRPKRRWHR